MSTKSGAVVNPAAQPSSSTDSGHQPSKSALIQNSSAGTSMHASNYLGSSASSSAGSRDAALAAATALHNLLLDRSAQQLVCDLQGIATVSKLLVPNDWLLAARAAGECGVSSWCVNRTRTVNHHLQTPCDRSVPVSRDLAVCTLMIAVRISSLCSL